MGETKVFSADPTLVGPDDCIISHAKNRDLNLGCIGERLM